MPRYFLSYSRADAQFARRFVDDLRGAGVDVWIDERDILPSQRFDRAIEAALRDCAAVLVLLSPRSVMSENVLDEVGFAIDHRKDVIPLLIESCEVPIRITRMQRIDFTGDYDAALERCKAALGRERAAPPRPRRGFDPQIVEQAEQALTLFVGPIAGKLVEAAAPRSRNASELYHNLAAHIADPADRSAFLRNAPQHSGLNPAVAFSRATLETAILELSKYLGPISRKVVEQISKEAVDVDDLYERVAARVADPDERAALLQRLRG